MYFLGDLFTNISVHPGFVVSDFFTYPREIKANPL
jgi:hypothetical protein